MNEYEKDAPYYYTDIEDLISLCMKIKQEWNDISCEDTEYSEEEYAYSQCFAERYLNEKFLGVN